MIPCYWAVCMTSGLVIRYRVNNYQTFWIYLQPATIHYHNGCLFNAKMFPASNIDVNDVSSAANTKTYGRLCLQPNKQWRSHSFGYSFGTPVSGQRRGIPERESGCSALWFEAEMDFTHVSAAISSPSLSDRYCKSTF